MDKSAIRRFAFIPNRKTRRKVKRIINKKIIPGVLFRTGNGKQHEIRQKTASHVYIYSMDKGTTVKIPISNIQMMVAYFDQIRIVERKELETFHSYNSIMFGLLHSVYKKDSKISRIGNALRLIKKGVRVFLAGGERCPSDLEVASRAGAKYVLFSYFYLRDRQVWKEYLRRFGFRCILDSGAYSEWMARQKRKSFRAIVLEEYIQFIKDNLDIIDHYFVLDVIGDHAGTMANLREMELQGLTPIPVFHMGTSLIELDKLVKEYPVVGLGGTVGRRDKEKFLTDVFMRYPKVAFHGLGITQADIIQKFSFFSVDSTSWLNSRRKERSVVLTAGGQVKRLDLSVTERIKKSIKFIKSLEQPEFFKHTTFVGEQLAFSFM